MSTPLGFRSQLLTAHEARQSGRRLVRAACARIIRPAQRSVLYGPAVFENPYQTLLYSAFDARVSVASPQRAPLYRSLRLADVYHLHWDEFHVGEGVEGQPRWQAPLSKFQARGGKLVWTVHNSDAHDKGSDQKQAATEAGRRFLCEAADLIHVHSKVAQDLVCARYAADPAKIVIVPHPSYVGWYRADVPPEPVPGPARYLAFGMFRENKGLDIILDGFRRLPMEVDIAALNIAGRGAERAGQDPVPGRPVHLHSGFVPDDVVAPMFARADFAVFGFTQILTSGSLMLALTFGAVPIAPDLPTVKEALPDALHDLLYVPGEAADLARVITQTAQMSQATRAELRAVALHAAEACHPALISAQLEAALP